MGGRGAPGDSASTERNMLVMTSAIFSRFVVPSIACGAGTAIRPSCSMSKTCAQQPSQVEWRAIHAAQRLARKWAHL